MKKEKSNSLKWYDKFRWWVIGSVSFALVIHIFYKLPAQLPWLSSVWGAGDILTYISTLILAWIAYYQNRRFKDQADNYQAQQDQQTLETNQRFERLQTSIDENIRLMRQIQEQQMKPYICIYNSSSPSVAKNFTISISPVAFDSPTTLRIKNVGTVNILDIKCVDYIINEISQPLIDKNPISTYPLSIEEVNFIVLPRPILQDNSKQIITITFRVNNAIGDWHKIIYSLEIFMENGMERFEGKPLCVEKEVSK